MTGIAEGRIDLVFKALAVRSRRRIPTVLPMGPGQASCCSGEEFCACDLMSPTGLRASFVAYPDLNQDDIQ